MIITQSYVSVPKDVRLNSAYYLIMKINNRKEFQNIAINHSTDIDYKGFAKIYRECTQKPYSFLQLILQVILENLRKFRFNLIKMTVTDQIKILVRKIMQNEARYDLDRKVAKISAIVF